jgi:hypothetical protein
LCAGAVIAFGASCAEAVAVLKQNAAIAIFNAS